MKAHIIHIVSLKEELQKFCISPFLYRNASKTNASTLEDCSIYDVSLNETLDLFN